MCRAGCCTLPAINTRGCRVHVLFLEQDSCPCTTSGLQASSYPRALIHNPSLVFSSAKENHELLFWGCFTGFLSVQCVCACHLHAAAAGARDKVLFLLPGRRGLGGAASLAASSSALRLCAALPRLILSVKPERRLPT